MENHQFHAEFVAGSNAVTEDAQPHVDNDIVNHGDLESSPEMVSADNVLTLPTENNDEMGDSQIQDIVAPIENEAENALAKPDREDNLLGTVVKETLSLEMKIIKACHAVIILTSIPAFGMAIELYVLSVEVSLGVIIMSGLCFTGSSVALYYFNDYLPNMRILMVEAVCGFVALFCASAAYDTFGTIMACGYTFGDQSYFTKAAFCVKQAGKESKTCDCANIYYDCIQFTSTKCYEDCSYCLESVPIRCETMLGLVCCYLFVSFLLSMILYCGSIWSDLKGRINAWTLEKFRGGRKYQSNNGEVEDNSIELVKAEEGERSGEVELYVAKELNQQNQNTEDFESTNQDDVEANMVSTIDINRNKQKATLESLEDGDSSALLSFAIEDNKNVISDGTNNVGTLSMLQSSELDAVRSGGIGNVEETLTRPVSRQDDSGLMVSVDDLENISHAVFMDAIIENSSCYQDDDNMTVATIPNIEDLDSVKVTKIEEVGTENKKIIPIVEDDNKSIVSIPIIESIQDFQRFESLKDDEDNTTIAENDFDDDDATINPDESSDDKMKILGIDAIPELGSTESDQGNVVGIVVETALDDVQIPSAKLIGEKMDVIPTDATGSPTVADSHQANANALPIADLVNKESDDKNFQ